MMPFRGARGWGIVGLVEAAKRAIFAICARLPGAWLPLWVKLRLLVRSGVVDPDWYAHRTGKKPGDWLELAQEVWNTRDDRLANALFDAQWYRQQHGVTGSPGALLLHYALTGERSGMPPGPWFDPNHARQKNPPPKRGESLLGAHLRDWRQHPHAHPSVDIAALLERDGTGLASDESPLVRAIRCSRTPLREELVAVTTTASDWQGWRVGELLDPASSDVDDLGHTPQRLAVLRGHLREHGAFVTALVSHGHGGGTEHHVTQAVIHRIACGEAVLVVRSLKPDQRRVEVQLQYGAELIRTLVAVHSMSELQPLFSALRVQQIEVHHFLGLPPGLEQLVRGAGVPWHFVLHDYSALCPQTNMTDAAGRYCGEPGEVGCNACLRARPAQGVRQIKPWRAEHAWLMKGERPVEVPSEDARQRIRRYLPQASVDVVRFNDAPLRLSLPARLKPASSDAPLVVGLIGTLAPHKGLARVEALVCHLSETGAPVVVRLVGQVESTSAHACLDDTAHFRATGAYESADLRRLVVEASPDVFLFASSAPETHSFTLSVAMATGRPIVALRHGAFPERLSNYPNSSLFEHDTSAPALLESIWRASGLTK